MGRLLHWISCASLASILVACTPGAPNAPNANSLARGVLVGESLLKYGQTSSQFGTVGGFNPAIVVVAHGTTIQFHNEDSFNHTATRISGPPFPPGNPIPNSALTLSGTDVSQLSWSSGALLPNAYSQALGTSKVGTFFFGCFYHYPIMRGVVIVQ